LILILIAACYGSVTILSLFEVFMQVSILIRLCSGQVDFLKLKKRRIYREGVVGGKLAPATFSEAENTAPGSSLRFEGAKWLISGL
jgi:hypothetical protein